MGLLKQRILSLPNWRKITLHKCLICNRVTHSCCICNTELDGVAA